MWAALSIGRSVIKEVQLVFAGFMDRRLKIPHQTTEDFWKNTFFRWHIPQFPRFGNIQKQWHNTECRYIRTILFWISRSSIWIVQNSSQYSHLRRVTFDLLKFISNPTYTSLLMRTISSADILRTSLFLLVARRLVYLEVLFFFVLSHE